VLGWWIHCERNLLRGASSGSLVMLQGLLTKRHVVGNKNQEWLSTKTSGAFAAIYGVRFGFRQFSLLVFWAGLGGPLV